MINPKMCLVEKKCRKGGKALSGMCFNSLINVEMADFAVGTLVVRGGAEIQQILSQPKLQRVSVIHSS